MAIRKAFTIEEKMDIITRLEEGESNKDLCNEYHVRHSTLSTIWKNREQTRAHFESDNVFAKRLRCSRNHEIEAALLDWVQYQASLGANAIVTGPILQDKANEFAKSFKIDNFYCSPSWILRFRKRHNLVIGRIETENASKASSSYESNASNSKLDKKRGSLAAKRRKPGCAEVSSCGGGRGLKEPRPAVGGEMFSAFGMHVAEELNNLPYEMATYCQKLINDAIFSAKLGELSKHSHIVTIPVPVPASQLPMEPVSGDKLYANNTYDNSNV